MYGARMIARQCITVSGVKTELLLSVTIVVNGEEGGVGTLGSESFPTCLPLRLASQGPGEVLSYFWISFGRDSVMDMSVYKRWVLPTKLLKIMEVNS